MSKNRHVRRYVTPLACLAALSSLRTPSPAAVPFVVANEAGFEGLEEASVLYFPDTDLFTSDPTNLANFVDEGGGRFRTTLRNYYPTLGWWDGDRATTNTDRQRTEVKGIDGLGHQKVGDTFEYSFDFRTNPGFTATSNFCHVFQLKATDGNDGPPLVTVTLRKNGSAVQGQIITTSDGGSIPTQTFSFTPGQWHHFVVRITTSAAGQATGAVQASVNGGSFFGVTNQQIYLAGSTDYRPKWGLYRSITTTNGVPEGESWVEHRTVTGYAAASKLLTWAGGLNGNAWDVGATQNFLNGAAVSTFGVPDQVVFNDASANTSVTLSGALAPNFVLVNSTKNYTFAGTGSLTGGSLRKDGSGTLTLATNNSYPGLTDVRGGTLFVTGSIGNNSLASITGGTLRAGSSTALGSNSTVGTEINAGGALDINAFNLSTETINVQGAGPTGAGAIVNTGAQQTSALTRVTLSGNTTIGGTGRWDIRGSGATLGTNGNAFNLTKTGSNQISLVGATIDPALANISVNQGVLAFQTSTTSMGDPTKTLSVGAGAIVGFYNTTSAMTKVATLTGGTIWAESGTGSQNTFAGPITLAGTGGTFDAGGGLTGGAPKSDAVLTITGTISGAGALSKNVPGTVTLAGAAPNTYTGTTNVVAGTLVAGKVGALGSGALNVLSGATARFAPGLPTASRISAIAPTINGGTIDLADNDLVVGPANSLASIESLIRAARNGGAWDRPGLTSSATRTNPATTLGVLSGGDYTAAGGTGTFSGQSYGATDNLVKYTWNGDANLDGRVTFDDYVRIDTGFNAGRTGWFNGDFNYDGVVNFDDYVLIDVAFNQQNGTLARAIDWVSGDDRSPAGLDQTGVPEVIKHFGLFESRFGAAFLAAVPEPAAVVWAMTPMTLLPRRRTVHHQSRISSQNS